MRFRRRGRAVLVSVFCLTIALALLALPSLLRALATRVVATWIAADFSYDRIRPDGWTGVIVDAPAFRLDDRVVLAADRAELSFVIAGRDWSLASILVDRPVLDLRREDLARFFRARPPSPEPWALLVEVNDGRGTILGETFSALAGAAEIDGAGDELRIKLPDVAIRLFDELIDGRLDWRRAGGATSAEAEARVGRTPVRLAWGDSLAIRLDRPDPEDLRRLLARALERFPEFRSDSWTVADLESLEHLSVTTDLATRHAGLVTGLRHRAFDGELKRMGFAIRDGVVTLDSIVLVAMVKGETTYVSSPEAMIARGELLFPRLVATSGRMLVEGSDLRIAGGEMSAEIDRFEAVLKEGRVAAHGRLAGPLASPGFEGAVRLSGLRFPQGGGELEMKVSLSDLADRITGRLDLTGGRLTIAGFAFRPSAARLLVDPGQIRFATPLRLTAPPNSAILGAGGTAWPPAAAPGVEAALQGALGLSGPLAAMLGRLEWNVVATDYLLPQIDSAVVARLTASGRGLNRWAAEGSGFVSPGLLIDHATARRTETGIEATFENLRRDEITVSVGRIVLRGGTEIEELEARGTLLGESIPFSLRIGGDSLALALDEKTWSGPIRLRWEGDRLLIEAEGIEGEGGRFSLAGSLLGRDGVRLASTFDARLGEIITPRLRERFELAGLDGRLRGEAFWGETASLRATLSDGVLETRGGARFTHLEGVIEWGVSGGGTAVGSTLRLARLKGRTEGGEFEADGTLLFEGARPGRLAARWSSRDFALAALAGFDTRLRELTGRADAEVTVAGTWEAPEIEGYIDLRDLAVPVAGLGLLREAAGRIEFARDGGTIRLAGRMGDGEVSAEGRLGGSATDVTIRLARVPLRPTEGVDGRFTGALVLTRPFENRYHLRGALMAEDARVLTERFAAPTGDRAAAAVSRLDLAIDVEIASIKLSGRDLLLTGKGRLAIRGTEIAPEVTGLLVCDAGRLVTRNATFRIREARIVLPEHGEITVTAHAASRVDRIRIFADVNGPISEPRIVLTSSPERSEAEIVTLLAVGREISEEGVVTSVTDQRLAGLALPLASAAGSGIGSGFGLENFRLEKSGTDTSGALFDRVAIGGYVSDRVYLGYSQATGIDPERRVEMELEVSPELFVKFEAGDRGTAGAGLEWRRDY